MRRLIALRALPLLASLSLAPCVCFGQAATEFKQGAVTAPPPAGRTEAKAGTTQESPAPAKAPNAELEARCIDGSILKLRLTDDKIDFDTAYGKLAIPTADIRKIELGVRDSDENNKQVAQAIKNLGASDFKVREAASEELLGLAERAYPALLENIKHPDAEVAFRIEHLLNKIRQKVREEDLNLPAYDTIFTDTSKIAGRIVAPMLNVTTVHFGNQQLKLSSIRRLRNPAFPEEDMVVGNILPDPGNMNAYQGQFGQTLLFRVTGNVNGALWGNGVYTTDSSLAKAAIHAGVLRHGQTGIVRVRMLGPQQSFEGTTRNGVTSSPFGGYPASFSVSR